MAMKAFGWLPADEIHVERIYALLSWVDDFMERRVLSANPPAQSDIAQSTNRWGSNLNQSFAEQPGDIRPTTSSCLLKLPGNVTSGHKT
jgi:hypothetical protein